jgi:hypothetical protein
MFLVCMQTKRLPSDSAMIPDRFYPGIWGHKAEWAFKVKPNWQPLPKPDCWAKF